MVYVVLQFFILLGLPGIIALYIQYFGLNSHVCSCQDILIEAGSSSGVTIIHKIVNNRSIARLFMLTRATKMLQ